MSEEAKVFLRNLCYRDPLIYETWNGGENYKQFLLSDLLHEYAAVYNEKNPGSPVIDIKLRREKFIANVTEKFSNIYTENRIAAFCYYWTQYNESGEKMRFETCPIFNIEKCLRIWDYNSQ